MDDQLTWKPHIAYIRRKNPKIFFVLNRVKEVLNKETMKILYSSLITPHLIYCIEVWGNTYQTNIKPVILFRTYSVL